jgi:hypothetical protein
VTGVETTAEERVVIRDVFPAVVTTGLDTYRNARAVVTRDRVYVWLTRATPVLEAGYDRDLSTIPRVNAPRSTRTYLRLSSGTALTIEAQRGCGCGNPLKGWTPWRPYRKATA